MILIFDFEEGPWEEEIEVGFWIRKKKKDGSSGFWIAKKKKMKVGKFSFGYEEERGKLVITDVFDLIKGKTVYSHVKI